MSKFLIKDSLKGEDTQWEEIFIEALLNNKDVTPRSIYLDNLKIFENKSAYQEVMEWFKEMFQQGYLIKIKGNMGMYSIKPLWIKQFKSLLEIVKINNEIKREALKQKLIKIEN